MQISVLKHHKLVEVVVVAEVAEVVHPVAAENK
jgi:hypothetical protein